MTAPSRMVRAFSVSLVALGAMVVDGPVIAEALDCRIAPPKQANERWVYRTIEGKRCWFASSNMAPDLELRWTKAALQELDRVRNARAAAPAAARPSEDPPAPAVEAPVSAAPPPVMDKPDENVTTFDARWRGLPM